MPTASDGKSFSNISATTAAFPLGGGRYGASAAAALWGSGSAKLQVLAVDGSTWIDVATAGGTPPNFTGNAYGATDLPAGSYRFAIATVTNVYVSIWRIPS